MSVDGHYIFPDNFNLIGLVLIQIELVSVRGVFSPRQNMTSVPPDEVRGAAIGMFTKPNSSPVTWVVSIRLGCVGDAASIH